MNIDFVEGRGKTRGPADFSKRDCWCVRKILPFLLDEFCNEIFVLTSSADLSSSSNVTFVASRITAIFLLISMGRARVRKLCIFSDQFNVRRKKKRWYPLVFGRKLWTFTTNLNPVSKYFYEH